MGLRICFQDDSHPAGRLVLALGFSPQEPLHSVSWASSQRGGWVPKVASQETGGEMCQFLKAQAWKQHRPLLPCAIGLGVLNLPRFKEGGRDLISQWEKGQRVWGPYLKNPTANINIHFRGSLDHHFDPV